MLLPETWAAVRAARADRLQTSMNLAVGSALACIGLTVPLVVLATMTFDLPLVLGLSSKEITLLAVTFLVSAVTLGTGRTYLMQGAFIWCYLLLIYFSLSCPRKYAIRPDITRPWCGAGWTIRPDMLQHGQVSEINRDILELAYKSGSSRRTVVR